MVNLPNLSEESCFHIREAMDGGSCSAKTVELKTRISRFLCEPVMMNDCSSRLGEFSLPIRNCCSWELSTAVAIAALFIPLVRKPSVMSSIKSPNVIDFRGGVSRFFNIFRDVLP